MKLFHFSEDPSIDRFEPHVPTTQPDTPGLVWAIDEEHAPHHFFPRDCPRVCFWTGPETIPEERERFFGHTAAHKIIAMEIAWLDRMRRTELFLCHLPPETFVLQDRYAGYYVSAEAVTPLKVEPAGDLLARLAASGVELRITPSLLPLRDALIPSTVPFSMIRMKNVAPKPGDHQAEE